MRPFFVDEAGRDTGLEQTVRTHDELIDFVAALRADRSAQPQKWEQSTLGGYLDAMARVARYEMTDDEEDQLGRWAGTAEWLWDGRTYE